jgi:hypothetical protein
LAQSIRTNTNKFDPVIDARGHSWGHDASRFFVFVFALKQVLISLEVKQCLFPLTSQLGKLQPDQPDRLNGQGPGEPPSP